MTDIKQTATTQSPHHFGTQLQLARESLKLSKQDIATRLRLNLQVIHALENNDLKNMPSTTFTRGYYRSYAKLLNFNDQEINAALANTGLILEERDFIAPALKTKQYTQSDYYLPILTILIVFILCGLVGIWWKTHTYSTESTPPTFPQLTQPIAGTPINPPTEIKKTTLPAMVPVTLPDSTLSSLPSTPKTLPVTKNPRKTPPFTDIIDTISEPGLDTN